MAEPKNLPSSPCLYDLPVIREDRGCLSYAEAGDGLPFVPKRYFVVFDVPAGQVRGSHAHRDVEQFLVCVKGSCLVRTDDGRSQQEFELNDPSRGLYLPRLVWAAQHDYSADAVLLVLSSDLYDPDEYIRDYQEFRRIVGTA